MRSSDSAKSSGCVCRLDSASPREKGKSPGQHEEETMLFIIETTAHHHQVSRMCIKSLLGDPRVIKNNVFCCVLCEEVSKTLIISMLFAMAAEEHV